MTLKELEKKLASKDSLKRNDALAQFRDGDYGLEALPLLRQLLADDDVSLVLRAISCVAKLGPEALTCDAAEKSMPTGHGKETADLEMQLYVLGGRIWAYSGYCNCYGEVLKALVKLQADPDGVIEFISHHIGLENPDHLIDSLSALKALGTEEAYELFQRAAAWWLPELGKGFSKKVQALSAGFKLER